MSWRCGFCDKEHDADVRSEEGHVCWDCGVVYDCAGNLLGVENKMTQGWNDVPFGTLVVLEDLVERCGFCGNPLEKLVCWNCGLAYAEDGDCCYSADLDKIWTKVPEGCLIVKGRR